MNESLNECKGHIHKDISTLSVDSPIINFNTLFVTPPTPTDPSQEFNERDVKYVFNN